MNKQTKEQVKQVKQDIKQIKSLLNSSIKMQDLDSVIKYEAELSYLYRLLVKTIGSY
jgi:negative regulator of replication initiation